MYYKKKKNTHTHKKEKKANNILNLVTNQLKKLHISTQNQCLVRLQTLERR